MIHIELHREPHWLDLGYGVSVLVRPISTALVMAARRMTTQAVPSVADAPTPEIDGRRAAAFLTALATLAIVDWRGIADADGVPAPVTAQAVAAVMDIVQIAEMFQLRYVLPSILIDQEKNVSPLSPTGSSAGAEDTAGAAPTPGLIAPAAASA